MRIIQEEGLTKLIPDEGKILFNNEGIESELVILGKYDKPENWQEKDKDNGEE